MPTGPGNVPSVSRPTSVRAQAGQAKAIKEPLLPGRAAKADKASTPRARHTTVAEGINLALRVVTLAEPARRFGKWIQRRESSVASKIIGGVFVAGANLTGGAIGIATGAVAAAGSAVYHIVESAARATGATALDIPVSDDDSPATNRNRSTVVTQEEARAALDCAALARGVLPNNKEFAHPSLDQIPPQIIAREHAHGEVDPQQGSMATLKYDTTSGLLSGDRWSALNIQVSCRKDDKGHPTKIFLFFAGTTRSFHHLAGNMKTNVAQVLGIEDSAMQESAAIVEAFVTKYGKEKVELVGHSMGGMLAQWAAVSNDVHATCFNSAGLHVGLRMRLGSDLVANAKVDHFNTSGDPLTQFFEHPLSPAHASAQVGRQHLIPGGGGHKMEPVFDGLIAVVLGPEQAG